MSRDKWPSKVVPPNVLRDAIAAREKKKQSQLVARRTLPEARGVTDAVFEQKCLTAAHGFVKRYREDIRALTDDFVSRLNTGGGVLGILTKMNSEIATVEMRRILGELRKHYKEPTKTKGELFESIRLIMADPENYSLIFRLAVFEAYILKIGPRAVK